MSARMAGISFDHDRSLTYDMKNTVFPVTIPTFLVIVADITMFRIPFLEVDMGFLATRG